MITQDQLLDFAQKLAIVAACAGFVGGLLSSALSDLLGAGLAWAADRARSRARVAAARARGGMGQRPMVDLSRTAYPMQSGAASPVRLAPAPGQPSHQHAASRRVNEQSDSSRGAMPVPPCPSSSFDKQPAAGDAAFAAGSGVPGVSAGSLAGFLGTHGARSGA